MEHVATQPSGTSLAIAQPPAEASLEQDERDPDPCPEDEEFFEVPDAESKEEAINKFYRLELREAQDPSEAHLCDFPDKLDKRAPPGSGWTPAELNHILQAHVVDGSLTTFGCVEWESQLFRGVMRARCYPFDMPKRRFHGFNPKVRSPYFQLTYQYILVSF